jgi:hypothetical protein
VNLPTSTPDDRLPDPAWGVPKRKYNLEAMQYDPEENSRIGLFLWYETPQGHDFWAKEFGWRRGFSATEEGRAALAEMKRQWESENV